MWRYLIVLNGLLLSAQAQPAFERVYGKAKGEAFHAVLSASDGSIVAVGYTSSTDPLYTDGYVVKLTDSGDTLWTRVFVQQYYEEANAVVEVPGGYVVGGVHIPPSPVTYDMYLVKYDYSGNVVWEKFFGGAGSEGANDGLVNAAGHLVFCGYSTSFTNGGSDMYVVETDLQGNLIRSANVGGAGHELAYGICQTADGGYVLIGYSNSTDAMFNMYVAKLDSTFALQWTRELGSVKEDVGFDVAEDALGNLWFVGFHTVTQDSIRLALVQTDAGGNNEQWHFPADAGDFGYRLLRRNSGFVVAGLTQTSGRGSQMMLLALDQAGAPLWKQAYGGTQSEVAFAVAEASNGQLLVCGTTEGFGTSNVDAYLVRCQPDGQIPCPTAVDFAASDLTPCEDITVFFNNNTVSSQTFSWLLNGLLVSQQDHWGMYFNEPGEYTIGLSACSVQTEQLVTVSAKPPAAFTYQQVNDTVYFQLASGVDYSFLSWNFGDNSAEVINEPAPAHVFPGAGPFWVTLTVTSLQGCDSVYVAPVFLSGQAVAEAGQPLLMPNPAEHYVYLAGVPEAARATLLNIQGVVLKRWEPPFMPLMLPEVPAGWYWLVAEAHGGQRISLPLVVR